MNKNKSNVATSPKKQTFSWKTFIAAFIVAFFLNIFLSAYSGVEPRKNIIWTIAWIYLSIEAWKFWKWKALLPYPLFIVLSIIASFVVMAAEHEYFSMLNLSVKLFFNFGGLLTFFLLLRKSQHNQDIVADAFPPVEYATEDQVATNSSKTLPRENHSTISLQKVVDEERVYDEIAKELETGVADKGLWTRLFAECDGDERQIKVLYIKRRAQHLIAAKHADMEQSQNEHFVDRQKNDKLGVEGAGLHNNKWATDKSQTSTTPTHDQFSEELKRIERRTLARICAIYPSTSNRNSDKRS